MSARIRSLSTLVLAAAGVAAADHAHAHASDASLHFNHPIVTESPSPDTKLATYLRHADGDEGSESELEVEAEYAFSHVLSIAISAEWASIDPEEGSGASGLAALEIAVKLANVAFAKQGILVTSGLEVGLPVGDDDDGLGSDHLTTIAPFAAIGWKHGAAETVAFFTLEAPINQDQGAGEEAETELEFDLSYLHHLDSRCALLLELNGSTVLSGDGDGTTEIDLSPGVKWKALPEHGLDIAFALSFPLHDDPEHDWQAQLAAFWHL